MQKRNTLSATAIIVSLIVLGFILYNFNLNKVGVQINYSPQQEVTNLKQSSLWNERFTEVLSEKEFKLSDYEGKTIIIESFSPSSPQCVMQQQELLALREDLKDSIIIVSFAVGINDDSERIMQYSRSNKFDWKFVASKEANNLLKNNFGSEFLTFSANPIKIVCPDGKIIIFESGIKSAALIKEKIGSC